MTNTSNLSPIGNYDVGYKKPPKSSQFQKGKSGNPSGRPKRKPSGWRLYRKILDRPVYVEIDGKRHRVSGSEAALMKMVEHATNGDKKACQIVISVEKA